MVPVREADGVVKLLKIVVQASATNSADASKRMTLVQESADNQDDVFEVNAPAAAAFESPFHRGNVGGLEIEGRARARSSSADRKDRTSESRGARAVALKNDTESNSRSSAEQKSRAEADAFVIVEEEEHHGDAKKVSAVSRAATNDADDAGGSNLTANIAVLTRELDSSRRLVMSSFGVSISDLSTSLLQSKDAMTAVAQKADAERKTNHARPTQRKMLL